MNNTNFLQPILENDLVRLEPLRVSDYEALFSVASDPKIWEQHPNNDRYRPEIFKTFFQTILDTGGVMKIIDKESGMIIGSTSFYKYDKEESSVFIGYTFLATKYWGVGINGSVKKLLLDYIFQYVENVLFHVGEHNIRSQIAVERLGAIKIGEELFQGGKEPKLNFVYRLQSPKFSNQ